jgi:hypothetical protein
MHQGRPNERTKSYTRIVLDPYNTPTVIGPLVKGARAGNRQGKVQYIGTTAVDNSSTNLIVAATAQREAKQSRDIIRNVMVALKLHISDASYLSDADDACSLVKFTNLANKGRGALKSHSGLLSFTL